MQMNLPFQLNSLPLQGVGTPAVESLYSYVLRLANSHDLRVNDLVRQLGPQTGQAGLQEPRYYLNQFHDTSFSGSNEGVRLWCALLERLTGKEGLSAGTYSTLGRLFNGRGSGEVQRQWCPHCLDESLAAGCPYMPLLWNVGIVSACPVHACELESVCPHCGTGCTPTGRKAKRFSMMGPGVCGTCGGWLGASHPIDKSRPARLVPPANDHDVCVAQQIGELIARPLKIGEEVNVAAILETAMRQYFGGSLTKLSNWVGLNKSTLHGWMHGGVVPELSRLVELALKLRISLPDLVTGNASALPASLLSGGAALTPRHREPGRPEAKRAALVQLLRTRPDMSLRAMARELGIDPRDIYYYCKDAAKASVHARRVTEEALRASKREAAEAAARKALHDLAHPERPPSVRDLRCAVTAVQPTLTYVQLQAVTRKVLRGEETPAT